MSAARPDLARLRQTAENAASVLTCSDPACRIHLRALKMSDFHQAWNPAAALDVCAHVDRLETLVRALNVALERHRVIPGDWHFLPPDLAAVLHEVTRSTTYEPEAAP